MVVFLIVQIVLLQIVLLGLSLIVQTGLLQIALLDLFLIVQIVLLQIVLLDLSLIVLKDPLLVQTAADHLFLLTTAEGLREKAQETVIVTVASAPILVVLGLLLKSVMTMDGLLLLLDFEADHRLCLCKTRIVSYAKQV